MNYEKLPDFYLEHQFTVEDEFLQNLMLHSVDLFKALVWLQSSCKDENHTENESLVFARQIIALCIGKNGAIFESSKHIHHTAKGIQ